MPLSSRSSSSAYQDPLSVHSLLEQGVTLITASRRLAHALRLEFAREAQQAGLKAWLTPQALPWTTWLRQQHLDRRAGQSSVSSRVLTPGQSRVLWDEIVAASPHAADLLNPSSAARLAARSWRRLGDYLIPLEQLEDFDTPEAQALHAWCMEFQRRCSMLGAIDESRLAHWAFESGLVPDNPLAFAGFDTMPPALNRLIERWQAQGTVRDYATDRQRTPRIAICKAPDTESEIELAAQWARDQVRGGAMTVGVIVPDLQLRRDAVQRAFEDVLAPGARHIGSGAATLPVVIAAPTSLVSYPLVDAAMLVLQLSLGTAPSTLVGRILRSPFIADAEVEAGKRALADVRLREEQRDRWDWSALERWAAVTGCDQLGLAARQFNVLQRSLPASASASQWAEQFHALLLAIGWPGGRTLTSNEHQTLEKFHDALAEFGALDAVTGRMNLSRAVRRLRDLLTDTQFEPETASGAITVIDAATSAGMQFDALWVTGLDADRWPAAINPDALIPIELQREAGIPEASAAGMLRQAVTQLQRWTSSARSAVVLSWPERDGDVEFVRSPLLTRVEETGDVSLPVASVTPLRHAIFSDRPTLELFRDDRAPALSAQEARGGARIIELQSRCPFRAQAELRLDAQPLPRVSLGVEPVDRGTILHRVLEDVWGFLQNQKNLLDIDDASLEARVRESAARHTMQALAADTPHGSRLAALEKESVVRLVMRLLATERTRPPFTVQLAEAMEQFRIGGLSVRLRPDRIDLLEGGGQLLIDYKLGDSHKPGDWFDGLGRPRRPQLPLYGLAHANTLRAIAYAVMAPGAVEYRGWSDGTPIGPGVSPYPGRMRIDFGDPQDWESLLHYWQFSLTKLAEQFVAGDARVDPLPQECATCHLSTFCRVNELTSDDDMEAGDDQ